MVAKRVFQRAPGALVEPVGSLWAAYSPLSNDTLLLNDESAAILEVLVAGPADTEHVLAALAGDCGLPMHELQPHVEQAWTRLLEGGLVVKAHSEADDNGRPCCLPTT